jgi:hypothetical protein
VRIELKSGPFEATQSQIERESIPCMINLIHSFSSTEERAFPFDADYQTPLRTTGKTATLGKRLLLSQKV